MGTIDLHCHSTVSDGFLSPTEVVQLAKQNGASILALTDHDHIGGIAEAKACAASLDMVLISGIEISVTWRQRTIHIVGLNFNEHDPIWQRFLPPLRQARPERLRRIAACLEKKAGIAGVYEGAMALAARPEMVGRNHVATFLVQQGYVKNKAAAFKKWLGDNKPCAMRQDWASLEDAVAAITQTGGVAVIAHPARYELSATAKRALLTEFKAAGGIGIEVASSAHNASEREHYADLANQYDFYASAGSDFHSLNDYGRRLGVPPELPERCRPIWTLFEAFHDLSV